MQRSSSQEKFEIVSPSVSKSITFTFNSEHDQPIQLVSYDEEKGLNIKSLMMNP